MISILKNVIINDLLQFVNDIILKFIIYVNTLLIISFTKHYFLTCNNIHSIEEATHPIKNFHCCTSYNKMTVTSVLLQLIKIPPGTV